MTQQYHFQAYTLKKSKLKKTHVPQCSLQRWLQQQGYGSNLDVHRREWIKRLWYIYTMKYYSAVKRGTFESVLMRWINLEPMIQSKVNQKKKNKYCILVHIYRIWKDDTDESAHREAVEMQTQRTELWTRVGEKRERVK